MDVERAEDSSELSSDIQEFGIRRWGSRRVFCTELVGGLLSVLVLLSSACGTRTIDAHPDDYAGVGVVLRTESGGTVIGKVMADGPADDAGLREGDRVLSIDGEYVGDRSLAAVVDMLRGRVGTQVIVGVENVTGRSEVVVTRARLVKGDGDYQRR